MACLLFFSDGTVEPPTTFCAALQKMPDVETAYRGFIPDGRTGPEWGYVLVTLPPVGDADTCVQVSVVLCVSLC